MFKKQVKRFFIFSILLIITASCSSTFQDFSGDFYEKLIGQIERVDACAIETRNNTKEISWTDYKHYFEEKFKQAKDTSELKKIFDQFGKGFTNAHSNFEFYKSKDDFASNLFPSEEIYFEYPEIRFYHKKSKSYIKKINGHSIDSLFRIYVEWGCIGTSKLSCARQFANSFNQGQIVLLNKHESPSFEYSNGNKLEYELTEKRNISNDSHNYYSYYLENDGWEIVETGINIKIFVKNGTFLLKIYSFYYGSNSTSTCKWGNEDICYDLELIEKTFEEKANKQSYLIIDVQENTGGNESTPFVKALSKKQFEDLPIQFRNIKEYNNDSIRKSLFFHNQSTENWYHNLSKIEKTNDFLPELKSFCNESQLCEKIKLDGTLDKNKFNKVVIVSNERCASACDDFVWRLGKFQGYPVIGQPNMGDAGYFGLTMPVISAIWCHSEDGVICQ